MLTSLTSGSGGGLVVLNGWSLGGLEGGATAGSRARSGADRDRAFDPFPGWRPVSPRSRQYVADSATANNSGWRFYGPKSARQGLVGQAFSANARGSRRGSGAYPGFGPVQGPSRPPPRRFGGRARGPPDRDAGAPDGCRETIAAGVAGAANQRACRPPCGCGRAPRRGPWGRRPARRARGASSCAPRA